MFWTEFSCEKCVSFLRVRRSHVRLRFCWQFTVRITAFGVNFNSSLVIQRNSCSCKVAIDWTVWFTKKYCVNFAKSKLFNGWKLNLVAGNSEVENFISTVKNVQLALRRLMSDGSSDSKSRSNFPKKSANFSFIDQFSVKFSKIPAFKVPKFTGPVVV